MLKKKLLIKSTFASLLFLASSTLFATDAKTSLNKPDTKNQNDYPIHLPAIPTPPSALRVITVGGSNITYTPRGEDLDGKIIFSQRRPPASEDAKSKIAQEQDEKLVGESKGGRVSTYLRAPLMDLKSIKEQLEKAGFHILAVVPLTKDGSLQTIVFTSEDLQILGKHQNSGFISTLRLLVDKVNNQITITNPLYFAKAYMGESYDEIRVKKVLSKLNQAFKGVKASKEEVKYTFLPKFRFMDGMPQYKDMVPVGKVSDVNALFKRLEKEKKLQFVLEISENSYLVGVPLQSKTAEFIKITGVNNAALLPVPVWIENGVAKIMEPRYYIAINYPMLKMSSFMKIATIPDAIKNDCQALFQE